MELGVYTFVETMPDPNTGHVVSPQQRVADLLEEVVLADQLGLDVFGIGEHHRPEYVASAPAVLLAAAAARTQRIRLTSAVTVLSSDDPVRVHQEFSLVDLISGGRAEIMVGRGSFIESYPLFGFDLDDYDKLFAEKLDLLLQIRKSDSITWQGEFRAPIEDRGIYPRPVQAEIPIWIAVGGTPQSVARAGKMGLPLALAIIGGMPDRFSPLFELYRKNAHLAGHDVMSLPTSINSLGYIADTSQGAADEFYPSYEYAMGLIGKERGWPPGSRLQYEGLRSPKGSLFVGSPQEIVDKILYEWELFGHRRFLMQMSVGSMPHDRIMRSIELFGTQVAPAVRKALR